MDKFMLGKKAGMTQIFDENGSAIPVTVIACGPVTVLQKKTVATDGYEAIKLGFDEKKESRTNKPDKGQFAAASCSPRKYICEFRVDSADAYELGQELNVAELFSVGDRVDVSGQSKGKGFAGNIKRHGQKGGKEAHGSKYHRRVGSLGSSATPSRVLPGKLMPGHMGAERVTVQNLDVVLVDGERNILALRGAVPGIRGAYLEIRQTVKA